MLFDSIGGNPMPNERILLSSGSTRMINWWIHLPRACLKINSNPIGTLLWAGKLELAPLTCLHIHCMFSTINFKKKPNNQLHSNYLSTTSDNLLLRLWHFLHNNLPSRGSVTRYDSLGFKSDATSDWIFSTGLYTIPITTHELNPCASSIQIVPCHQGREAVIGVDEKLACKSHCFPFIDPLPCRQHPLRRAIHGTVCRVIKIKREGNQGKKSSSIPWLPHGGKLIPLV